MAVLAIITIDGDADALLAKYDAHDAATRDLPTTGLISHTVGRTPTGLVMADVWESDELIGAYMAQPGFRSALHRVGMPEPAVQLCPVDRKR